MQPLLPTFEPSDNDLIDRAMGRSLIRKIEQAVLLLKCWEESAIGKHVDGFQVGDSGGKDSDCIVELAKMAGVRYKATYNVTTIDPPELLRHLKKHRPDTEWKHSGHGHLILSRMVEKMSMPTRLGRWCCSEYKYCCSSEDSVGVVGVRIEESDKRAGMWKEMTVHSETRRIILAPLCYWTEKDVWEFHKLRDLAYCELYDHGFSRLGCVGCPINPGNQAKEFSRWPKYEAMWKEGAKRLWERGQVQMNNRGEKYAVGKFESWEKLYEWWLTGHKDEPEANCVFEEMMENV